MPVIGEFYVEAPKPSLEPDVYPATISVCTIVMDIANPKLPETDKWGKNRLLVKVVLDNEVGPDNGPIELSRKVAISYGQTAGTYSALAQLIQATLGIKCGDKAQRNVTTEQLLNAKVRVQTAVVEKDDKTYLNIVGFFAPKKAQAPEAVAEPAPLAAVKTPAARLGIEDDGSLDDLPF